MHLRSKRMWPRMAAVGWLVITAGVVGGEAQQPAAAPAPAKQNPAAKQPSLTVDRDPVPSPDADPPAQAQTGAPQGVGLAKIEREGGKYTLRQDAYEVRLNATVLDGSGRSVQTLTKDAFSVYEDGVPQTIASFRHEDLPVSLGLLIDSSGSMYDKRSAVEKAALDFVKLSNPEDEEFLVDFSWEAFIDQDFTNNIDKLQQGLGYVKSSGGTAIYDALVASADYLSKNAKHPKQVLLVVTDGEDNASSATLEQTIRRIQDLDGPVIYCVGLLFGEDTDKRESRHARRVLETLAEQTGGAAYFPKSIKDVDAVASEVAQDIRTQYTIAYHSTKSPTLGGYREVHVEAKAKSFGRLSVRTRSGYYPRVAQASKGGDAAGFSSDGKKNP
jgi:Ca-activated chloride channel family protein